MEIGNYLFAIDLYQAMYYKLPCLTHTARKHGSEYSGVESPLQRMVGHLHVWGHWRRAHFLLDLCTHSSTGRLFRSIICGQVSVVHANNGGQLSHEHSLPLLLPHLLAMVCSRCGLGSPFLLKVSFGGGVWRPKL